MKNNKIHTKGFRQGGSLLLLQSAVGKTRVLRSRLVMNYTTSHFPLIVLGYPLDTYLSIEAQCVSHHYPPVDCHSVSAIYYPLVTATVTIFGYKNPANLEMELY